MTLESNEHSQNWQKLKCQDFWAWLASFGLCCWAFDIVTVTKCLVCYIKFSADGILKYPLKCQTQQLSSALSSACYFKSHCCKQCGPRSDCSSRSSHLGPHCLPICKKVCLKSLQEGIWSRWQTDDIFRYSFYWHPKGYFLVFFQKIGFDIVSSGLSLNT